MEINFSQVREDPEIETFVIDKVKNPTVLIIGSGGCTLFTLMCKSFNKITVIDSNISQLYLIELKIQMFQYFINKELYILVQALSGKLDKICYDNFLQEAKNKISSGCYNYFHNNMHYLYDGLLFSGKYEKLFLQLVQSNYNFDDIFSTENLTNTFGKEAVKNSKMPFSEHFKNIFQTYKNNYTDNNNYFYYSATKNSYNLSDLPKYFSDLKTVIQNYPSEFNRDLTNFINSESLLLSIQSVRLDVKIISYCLFSLIRKSAIFW